MKKLKKTLSIIKTNTRPSAFTKQTAKLRFKSKIKAGGLDS
jgi:hypothetical protein